ncbi:MAG TPA: cytochrome P460 family protein [Steroidobacteraceae bacterium]
MKTKTLMLIAALTLLGSLALSETTAPAIRGPVYTDDGRLALPEDYREWVYLSSGFDMAYSPQARAGHHMFDNVFVEPSAYKAFLATGTWPDKTMLILEVRGAQDKGSINKSGQYQDTDVMGLEVHLKDSSHFPEGWAFFGFDGAKAAKIIPRTADCYSCHAQHTAVDNTFVQFYPTLLPIATAKGTLSAAYQAEAAGKH